MFRIALFPLLAIFASANPAVVPVFEIQNGPVEIDLSTGQRSFPLASFFKAETIDDQVVRFVAEYDDGTGLITKNLDFALFSDRTPVTRANFLNYVDAGDYIGTFIHRSAANFVIQGGGFAFETVDENTTVVPVDTDPPIVNEPGISNTLGTISMAKTAESPDTATSQWFVSTDANSANLDYQNGGFTVFARITRETLPNALLFNNTTEFPPLNFGGALNSTPVHKTTPLPSVPILKFIAFRSVSLVPLPAGQAAADTNLGFTITTPPSATLATVSLSQDNLIIQPTATGTGSLSISATDSVGNEVIGRINLLVGTSYATWRAANFSGSDLTDGNISGPNADPDGNGITNLQAFAQGLGKTETKHPTTVANPSDVRITYLRKTDALSTRIAVQRSTTLGSDWTNVTATEISSTPTPNPDQESVTISVPKSPDKAFYRLSFELLPN